MQGSHLGTWPGAVPSAEAQGGTPPGRDRARARLTALDGVGRGLQGHDPAAGLGDVDAEHQPHPGVLPPDVRLALAQLDVGVSQLQDPGAVDAVRRLRAHG